MMHVRRILFPIAFSEAVAAMAPSVREMAEHFKACGDGVACCQPRP